MKKETKRALFAGGAIGIILGVFVTAVALNLSGDQLVLKEMRSPYNDFDKTVETIINRIQQTSDWKVMSVLDYNKIVTENGYSSIGKIKLIKFCSSKHASQMLAMDDYKKLGAMLPKTIAVYEKSDGHIYVAMGNGLVMGRMFDGEAARIIEKVSYEIEDIMRFMNFKFTLF